MEIETNLPEALELQISKLALIISKGAHWSAETLAEEIGKLVMAGAETGYSEGFSEGREQGHSEGFSEGWAAGMEQA